jgi:hypothetical protein
VRRPSRSWSSTTPHPTAPPRTSRRWRPPTTASGCCPSPGTSASPQGVNAGLARLAGRLVLLNNDTVVPPGTLAGLGRHLQDPGGRRRRTGHQPLRQRGGGPGDLVDVRRAGRSAHGPGGRARRPGLRPAGPHDVLHRVPARRPRPGRRARRALRHRSVRGRRLGSAGPGLRACGWSSRRTCSSPPRRGEPGRPRASRCARELFARNRALFEAKWGPRLGSRTPTARRPATCARSARCATPSARELPADAGPLVVSKGDSALLRCGRSAGHFPQDEPATSRATTRVTARPWSTSSSALRPRVHPPRAARPRRPGGWSTTPAWPATSTAPPSRVVDEPVRRRVPAARPAPAPRWRMTGTASTPASPSSSRCTAGPRSPATASTRCWRRSCRPARGSWWSTTPHRTTPPSSC